jgi:hypothetical protein
VLKETLCLLFICLLLTACTVGIVQRKEIVQGTPAATVLATATPDTAKATLAALQTENAMLATQVAIAESIDWYWYAYTASDMWIDPSLQDRYDGADPYIYDIVIAPDGMWAGSQYGISHFAGAWTTYTAGKDLPGGNVLSVAVAPDGAIWVGTYSGGVSRFYGASWTTFSTADGLLDANVYAIAVGYDGTVWAGTHIGLAHFDGSTWVSYTAADGLSTPSTTDLVVARDGSVWGAAWPGVYHFDGSTWTFYTVDDGLPGENINAIAIDNDNTVWVGGEMGVASFDGASWTFYGLPRGLSNVFAIDPATDGTLWVGGDGGVSHFDDDSWITYTVADGLIHPYVRSIAVESSRGIWVGTEYGLSRYGPPLPPSPTRPPMAPPTKAIYPTATPTSPPASPTPCTTIPGAAFRPKLSDHPEATSALGCPIAGQQLIWTAEQAFQNGRMLWKEDRDVALILFSDDTTYLIEDDLYIEGDPEDACPEVGDAPEGLYKPVRGFNRQWCNVPDVRARLGWALEEEIGYNATWQQFEHGVALLNHAGHVLILYDGGTWGYIE